MRSFPLIALLPAVVLLAALLLVGCGGSDFEGEVDVPDGYETYSGNGVSFVHPAAWAPTTRELTDRVTEIRFQDPETDDPNAAAVSFTMQDDVADRFDAMLDSQRELLETTRDAKVSQEAVDVPGARLAYRSRIELPGDGDGASTSEAVDVLTPAGRHLALAAGGPDEDDSVDAGAVVDSLRLEQR